MQLRGVFYYCKTALQYLVLPKSLGFPMKESSFLVSQRMYLKHRQSEKHFGNSYVRLKNNSYSSTFSKYELFSREEATEILDVEKERQGIVADETVPSGFEGVNLERGINGVFEIDEIVWLLKKEKGEDMVILQIPPEYNYADHLVIVSGRSKKHMEAMCDVIRRFYKVKVRANVNIPKVEGKNSNIWMALDLGNIILHVFSKSGREIYDLETLWSVGRDFDTFTQKKNTSPNILSDYSKLLSSLSPNS